LIVRFCFVIVLFGYLLLLPRYVDFLRERPVEVKLGYIPHPQVLRATVADQRLAVAQWIVTKTLFYYGTLVDKFHENVIIRPEFANMYRTLLSAIRIDPYNMDAYYFTQASFTWELQRIEEVNRMLETGLQYRTWDPWIPFYMGFNYAYFLKDYERAAVYMKKAAEISGNPLFTTLAARYFYESAQTDLGMVFLNAMIEQAKDEIVKQTYQLRRDALVAVITLEQKVAEFKARYGRSVDVLEELVEAGLLDAVPADPYGGDFYLDATGRIRSTSKFAMSTPGAVISNEAD
jgi:hypothetical protein